MKKLMIIEDSEGIRNELTSFLIKYGYEVIAPVSFENIINDIRLSNPDLILLDINLPAFDGFYICREIRKEMNTPIIIVTSRNSEIDELMSMNLGADNFITKPYNTQILLAHINAVLKRTYGDKDHLDLLRIRDLELDLSRGTIKAFDNTLEISKNELKILACLKKIKKK